jgi:hypothetical protein
MKFLNELFGWLKRTRRSSRLPPASETIIDSPPQLTSNQSLLDDSSKSITAGDLLREFLLKHPNLAGEIVGGTVVLPFPLEPPTVEEINLPTRMETPTAPPADPYAGRKQEAAQHLGMVAPTVQPASHRTPPADADMLDDLSQALQERLRLVRDAFIGEHAELKFDYKSYVILDACAGVMAEWSCSEGAAQHSPWDVPTSISISVELLQYNFTQQQKELFARFGRWVH